jgi:hypothetical protein
MSSVLLNGSNRQDLSAGNSLPCTERCISASEELPRPNISANNIHGRPRNSSPPEYGAERKRLRREAEDYNATGPNPTFNSNTVAPAAVGTALKSERVDGTFHTNHVEQDCTNGLFPSGKTLDDDLNCPVERGGSDGL